MCLEKIKRFLEELKEVNIKFKNHFYERTIDRPISDQLVRKYLKKIENLTKVEKQQSRRENEEKYKVWFKLSSKYALVLIVAIFKKTLYIITAWNKGVKWKKLKQK